MDMILTMEDAMDKKDYKKRIVDSLLDLKLESFGATLIKGPKGCGKTTSAKFCDGEKSREL